MKRASAYALAASLSWAISAQWLETILNIAKGEGEDLEALEARLGRPLGNTQVAEERDGVGIIPMVGPVFRRANLFTQVSGATSIEILARDFTAALENKDVRAILLNVDSPGGEVSGINEFAEMVRAARGKKPIYAYVGHQACSAAYWIASAADKVIVDATAEVGSIGVVAVMANPKADEASKKIEIVSTQSPRKRTDPTTDEGRALVQAKIDEIADVFVGTVATNRGVSAAKVMKDFGGGGTLIGKSAVDAGMADGVGSFESTVAALVALSRKGSSNMDLKKIALSLGLSETATEAEVETALAERQELLRATGAKSCKEAIGAVAGMTKTGEIAQAALDRAVKLEADARERELQLILEKNAEKFPPADRDFWLEKCGAKRVDATGKPDPNGKLRGADPEQLAGVASRLTRRAVLDKGHEAPEPTQVTEGATALPHALALSSVKGKMLYGGPPDVTSPEAKKVMRLMGLTPSRIKAAWEKRVERAADLPE